MALTSIGDMAQHFISLRHNTQLKQRLNTLTQEMATGQAADLNKRLGGDRGRFSAIDHRLAVISGYDASSAEAANRLGLMQTTLDTVNDQRDRLANQMISINVSNTQTEADTAASSAKDAFSSFVGAFNARLADKSLFAGTATNQPALADADQILADLTAVVSGLGTAAEIVTAIDNWFDNPTGGFATTGYLGDPSGHITQRIDESQTVTMAARADDPAVRDLLKATAYAAVSSSVAGLSNDEKANLLRTSGESLFTAAQGVVDMQARLGATENKIEEGRTALTAQKTTLTLMRNSMIAADPFETASALQEVQIQLETHYTLTARLSHLTLLEYLR